MCRYKRLGPWVFLAGLLCTPAYAMKFMGTFSGLALHVDTQIETPATHNNVKTLPVPKAGDTIRFQLFAPAGGGNTTNGYTLELDVPGKTVASYIGTVSGVDWSGNALVGSGAATLSALFLSGATVPSSGYLGQVSVTVTRELDAGARLTVKRMEMTSGRDVDKLAVGAAEITFTAGGNAGDFNNDGRVDLADFLAFANMFGTSSGASGYDARGDFDNDGSINLSDFLAFVEVFGATYPVGGGGGGAPTQADLDIPKGLALDVSAGKMYWTDFGTDKIHRANLDGSQVETLISTGLDDPKGLALDVSADKMYWTDYGTDRIHRANLDGSQVETLISTGLRNPEGLALDVSAGKMYWTSGGISPGNIHRANLDGSQVETLVSGFEQLEGLALDVSAGKTYWTDLGADKIHRANLDGSQAETLISTGLDNPNGLALDVSAGKMYWTETGADRILRANLDGSQVETLVIPRGSGGGGGGGDTQATPTSPRNIRVARVGSNVRVTWSRSSGAAYYDVWRCNDSVSACTLRSSWRKVGRRITGTAWLDTSVPTPAPGITVRLRYIVQACNSAGCSGQL